MEPLSRQLSHMQQIGDIRGLRIARKAPIFSHVLFVDDALFFLKGTIDNVWNLMNVLNKFCNLSREMVNHQKSYVVFSEYYIIIANLYTRLLFFYKLFTTSRMKDWRIYENN